MLAFIKKLVHKHEWEDLPWWKQQCKVCSKIRTRPLRRASEKAMWIRWFNQ